MGVYLNSKNPFGLFCDEAMSNYFIDKSELLCELIPLVAQRKKSTGPAGEGKKSIGPIAQGQKTVGQEEFPIGKSNKYVCITRPRRFGKPW